MTKRESVVFTAFTGVLFGPFDAFHEYSQELMGRSVFTHEMASKGFWSEVRELSKPEFILICEAIEE